MGYVKNLTALVCVCIVGQARAQLGSILKDTGLLKLSVFIGKWEARSAPGSNDSTTAVYGCRWSENGHFLVCDQVVSQPGKSTNNLSIYSYDGVPDAYTLSLVGIPGADPFSIPVRSRGDTLIYLGQYKDQGNKVYTRTLNIFNSYARYQFVTQTSTDSLNWKTISAGASIRIMQGPTR